MPVAQEPASAQPDEAHRRDIHTTVLKLAWPSVAAMLLQTVNSLLDVFFVGHLPQGRDALAATGVGGMVVFLLVSSAMGVTVGTTALVARFTGGRDPENALKALGQSITLCAILALFFGIVAFVLRQQMVVWLLDTHRSPEAGRLCVQFLTIVVWATLPMFLLNALVGAFRGIGDMQIPMRITAVMIAIHISFNYLLIYGHGGFPAMGVRGAATAFVISQTVAMLLFFDALIRRSPLAAALQPGYLALRLGWAIRILKIGVPAALAAVLRTLAMMSFSGVLARTPEGAAAVAAMQVGLRMESIAFMPGFGYAVAASTLVGQSLGARSPRAAERFGWAAAAQGILVMSLSATLFFVFAQPFAALFTKDRLVRYLAADYLRVNAVCEPFLGLQMVLTGALNGAGDTLWPTLITLATMWLVRLPLASLLMFRFHMHTHGGWVSMSLSTILGGILTLLLFRAGGWKRKKV